PQKDGAFADQTPGYGPGAERRFSGLAPLWATGRADAKHCPWPQRHNEGNINHIMTVPRGSHFVDGSKGW
ncbi:hypothetical protein ACPXA0_26025, partial [Escherichia coli]|uniref:hypothetical protein n=1 Tax=Escherichia coli TaxID=562 RepID=UPI003CE56637